MGVFLNYLLNFKSNFFSLQKWRNFCKSPLINFTNNWVMFHTRRSTRKSLFNNYFPITRPMTTHKFITICTWWRCQTISFKSNEISNLKEIQVIKIVRNLWREFSFFSSKLQSSLTYEHKQKKKKKWRDVM